MENEIIEILNNILTQYNCNLPFSVMESLVTTIKLRGIIYPIKYETHFKPFVDMRDNVYFNVSYYNKTVMEINRIFITGIKENQEEFFLEKFIDSNIFNWYWRDEFDKKDREFFFIHLDDEREVIEMQPMNQTVTLVLTVI